MRSRFLVSRTAFWVHSMLASVRQELRLYMVRGEESGKALTLPLRGGVPDNFCDGHQPEPPEPDVVYRTPQDRAGCGTT